MSKFLKKLKDYRVLFVIILAVSVFIRVWQLGVIPGNGAVNQDEAYAGYEAYSLLHWGYDADGYRNPVYFTAWGSGMNAMETYCMIPFIAVFGLKSFAIRLPMAVLSIITVIAFALLLKDSFGEKESLIGMAFLSVAPWHIMMSRWALESNFLPGFCLLALFFLHKSITKRKYFIFSMLFYGLSLYTYSSPWIIMPFLIGFSVLYLLLTKQITFDRYLFIGLGVLVIVALPLLLFVMVNMGLINEIRTPIISIPKLIFFRSNDVVLSWDSIRHNIKTLLLFLIKQNDGLPWNSIPQVGVLYLVSYPFVMIGLVVCFVNTIKHFKNAALDTLINIQFLMALVLGVLVEINANRINIIMIPLVYYCCRGISEVLKFLSGKKICKVGYIIPAAYIASFIYFCVIYFGIYNTIIASYWNDGLDDALSYAGSAKADEIHVMDTYYPNVLFYTEYPADRFLDTVKWIDPDSPFREVISFEKYDLTDFTESDPASNNVYICRSDNEYALSYMNDNNMDITFFDNYALGYNP